MAMGATPTRLMGKNHCSNMVLTPVIVIVPVFQFLAGTRYQSVSCCSLKEGLCYFNVIFCDLYKTC